MENCTEILTIWSCKYGSERVIRAGIVRIIGLIRFCNKYEKYWEISYNLYKNFRCEVLYFFMDYAIILKNVEFIYFFAKGVEYASDNTRDLEFYMGRVSQYTYKRYC